MFYCELSFLNSEYLFLTLELVMIKKNGYKLMGKNGFDESADINTSTWKL